MVLRIYQLRTTGPDLVLVKLRPGQLKHTSAPLCCIIIIIFAPLYQRRKHSQDRQTRPGSKFSGLTPGMRVVQRIKEATATLLEIFPLNPRWN